MVQIARTTLRPNRLFFLELQKIFGIGKTTCLEVTEACGISTEMKVKDIKEPYIQKVAQYIQDNHMVGDALKRSIRDNILEQIQIKSYTGTRHEIGLPISGRTHGNGKTARRLRHHIMYDTSRT